MLPPRARCLPTPERPDRAPTYEAYAEAQRLNGNVAHIPLMPVGPIWRTQARFLDEVTGMAMVHWFIRTRNHVRFHDRYHREVHRQQVSMPFVGHISDNVFDGVGGPPRVSGRRGLTGGRDRLITSRSFRRKIGRTILEMPFDHDRCADTVHTVRASSCGGDLSCQEQNRSNVYEIILFACSSNLSCVY